MEPTILSTIHQFIIAGQRFEQHRAGSSFSVDLKVEMPSKYDNEGPPKITLTANFFDGKHYQSIAGASLREVMDEASRRAGFTDRQAMKIDDLQAGLVALAAPEPASVVDEGPQ